MSALWAASFWIPQECLGTAQLNNLSGPAGEKIVIAVNKGEKQQLLFL